MLLSPLALKSLNSIEKILPRMIIATFNGNPRTTIISCYSPTNVTDETEVITFYQELSSLIHHVPKHNVLVVGGDMNAHVGQTEEHKYSYHQSTNRNGEHMLDFATENGLACLNTQFQKKKGKLWTHTHPNGANAQLDYVFINKKWINSATNCEAFNTFEGVSSDHRIVSLKIRLSLRANKQRVSNSPRYDWSTLSSNTDIRNQYAVSVKNRFNALQVDTENPSPNTTYENFVTAHHEAATEKIPVKPKIKSRVPWESKAVIEKRECLKKPSLQKKTLPSKTNTRKFNKAQKDLATT